MPSRPKAHALALAALLLALPAAQAGRPFVTEDAGLLGRGACEWESVAASGRVAGEPAARGLSTQLACGLGAGLQLGASLSRLRTANAGLQGSGLVGKWALWRQDASAFTLAGASSWSRPRGGSTDWEGASLQAVLSQGLDGGWTAHANLGRRYSRAERRRHSGWAVLVERRLGQTVDLGAELFGEGGERPGGGLGLRWRPAEGWSLDAGLTRSGGQPRERQLSLGVKLEF